jgi:hypothetical protein
MSGTLRSIGMGGDITVLRLMLELSMAILGIYTQTVVVHTFRVVHSLVAQRFLQVPLMCARFRKVMFEGEHKQKIQKHLLLWTISYSLPMLGSQFAILKKAAKHKWDSPEFHLVTACVCVDMSAGAVMVGVHLGLWECGGIIGKMGVRSSRFWWFQL